MVRRAFLGTATVLAEMLFPVGGQSVPTVGPATGGPR